MTKVMTRGMQHTVSDKVLELLYGRHVDRRAPVSGDFFGERNKGGQKK